MCDISKTAELKEYILNKLAIGGISEDEICSYLFFNDKFDRMGNFVYCRDEKYCLRYMGYREAECCTYTYDEKEELLNQIILHIAIAKYPTGYDEYVSELTMRINEFEFSE